tara:strand:- start:343 stop:726 length:384 start_codon:yes stop_codon:yes gene_type:complete
VKKLSFSQFTGTFLSLFTSFSTLICCALPVLLVTLGMGASLASLISLFPWIVIVSKYKIQIFIFAGFLLLISAYSFWQGKYLPCPSDPVKAKSCSRLRTINLIMLIISTIIYFVGFFFAFLAVKIFN